MNIFVIGLKKLEVILTKLIIIQKNSVLMLKNFRMN